MTQHSSFEMIIYSIKNAKKWVKSNLLNYSLEHNSDHKDSRIDSIEYHGSKLISFLSSKIKIIAINLDKKDYFDYKV